MAATELERCPATTLPDYVATSGNRTVRTLSRLELDLPCLEAWCHPREDKRTLCRIRGVMSPAPE
ncbi:hypothetical protein ABZ307_10030 [Streptomyces griseorubiginosus]|uniref:hypothetical protein n=1 Tax=Streptomyces griseorubiginosus TaxID=67304 RepID=UPI0033AAE571